MADDNKTQEQDSKTETKAPEQPKKLTRENLSEMIAEEVGKALAPLQSKMTDHMARFTAPAQPKAEKKPGTDFARLVRSIAAARGVPQFAAQFAEKTWGTDAAGICKALMATDATAGGFLVPQEYSAEIIELLRNRSVVRAAGARVVPMSGSMTMPKLTGGATASYIGETQNIPKSEQTFGQLVLNSKKLSSLVPISNDLLRTSNPQADTVVREDMLSSLALAEDANFLRGAGTGYGPKGILNWAAAGQVTGSAGTTSANVETDIKALLNALATTNTRMLMPVFIMNPRSWNHLRFLRDGTSGELLFPETREVDPSAPNSIGSLLGYPVYTTNQVPINLGGGTETEIYFLDMADVIIGDEMSIEVSISNEAAYHDGSGLVSAFSTDQTVIKAISKHDLVVRHDTSIAVKNAVTWGAS